MFFTHTWKQCKKQVLKLISYSSISNKLSHKNVLKVNKTLYFQHSLSTVLLISLTDSCPKSNQEDCFVCDTKLKIEIKTLKKTFFQKLFWTQKENTFVHFQNNCLLYDIDVTLTIFSQDEWKQMTKREKQREEQGNAEQDKQTLDVSC